MSLLRLTPIPQGAADGPLRDFINNVTATALKDARAKPCTAAPDPLADLDDVGLSATGYAALFAAVVLLSLSTAGFAHVRPSLPAYTYHARQITGVR